MFREIGSEFFTKEEKTDSLSRSVKVLSGRSALDFIIRDIKSTRKFETVALPSYLCDSVIEPFVRNGIKVLFYKYNNGSPLYDHSDCDAVFVIDYFGYVNENLVAYVNQAKNDGKIVIYDGTHYLRKHKFDVDYTFVSYRKWCYANYAEVWKKGKFNISFPERDNSEYISLRDKAAFLKQNYIEGKITEKKEYLDLFAKAEKLLEEDYKDFRGEETFVNKEFIIKARKDNAQRLMDGLSDIEELRLVRSKVSDLDTPLFVPVFVKNEIREELRKKLISESIYCPIHWPLSKYHSGIDEKSKIIYNEELSLVCDQRYSASDIDREISVVRSFFGR